MKKKNFLKFRKKKTFDIVQEPKSYFTQKNLSRIGDNIINVVAIGKLMVIAK